jgi:tRNA pseudouridine13 synthase
VLTPSEPPGESLDQPLAQQTSQRASPGVFGDPIGTMPMLTAGMPGIGGRLKEREEDFIVEEIPAYPPSGEGEHVYLFVEKRGLSTSQLVHAIARHFGVQRGAVGYAGMKDKQAVTRQVISVHTPGKTFNDFPELVNEKVTVLRADMHANKLRLGHLRGNRFSIRVRGVRMADVLKAQRVLAVLAARGIPNLVGEQRFGVRLNNHVVGALYLRAESVAALSALLGPDAAFPERNAEARALYAQGDYTRSLDAYPPSCRHERVALRALETGSNPDRALRAIDVEQRRFWFSALQSAIFNHLLAARVIDGTFERLVEGDVAYKHENGAMFAVGADELGTPEFASRAQRFEISPTGPLWGAGMMRASGAIDEREVAALADAGMTQEHLKRAMKWLGDSMSGGRRAMRAAVSFPSVEGGIDEHGDYVRCDFELPPGSYATVVMREIMKPSAALLEPAEHE